MRKKLEIKQSISHAKLDLLQSTQKKILFMQISEQYAFRHQPDRDLSPHLLSRNHVNSSTDSDEAPKIFASNKSSTIAIENNQCSSISHVLDTFYNMVTSSSLMVVS
jgi:hypothetical protein